MDIESGATPFIFERYLVDGYEYSKSSSPVVYQGGLPISPWITNQNDFLWAEAIQIPQQIALMQTAVDASLASSEKVEGADCYVLDIIPSYEAMADWILSQDQHEGPSLGSSFGGPTLAGKDAFMKFNKGSSVRFWISQDNYLILKSEESGAFSATAEELGLNPKPTSFSKITSTFQGQTVFSNYNQPVDIEPPTEAELNPATPLPPPPANDQTQVITFKDPNLEQAVRQAISKPQGVILVGDVANLLIFQAINSGIKDLSGLEYFTKLNVLMLDGNNISDISQLAKLQKLGLLHLENNQISDISALSSIWNPLILDLSDNRISDVSPLKSLNSLGTLDLGHNQVSDISPLLEITGLKSLSLEDNPLSADTLNKYIPQLKAKGIAVGQ
jgi:Leucine-rich repeat (LRR) protein